MLASRLVRPLGRQLLSRSPIAAPPSLIRPRTRAFHATAPRKDAVVDAFLTLPHEMMSLIHSQLPWHATIPLAAFLVRGLLVTTAGSYSRALTARYMGTHPVRQALAYQRRNELMLRGGFNSPKQAKLAITAAVKKETEPLDKRWDCTLRGQVGWTLAQIPIFFTMAEVVRQMCGTRDGLLGVGLTALGLKSAPETVHGVSIGPANPWFEPSLANEGMLWFPDLLVADPFLPFLVSGLMFGNIYFSKNGLSADPTKAPKFTRVMRYTLLSVSLLIGPMCQQVPAALMFYWASSTASVMLWNVWLDWRYPAPRDFMACKRPLQLLGQQKALTSISPPQTKARVPLSQTTAKIPSPQMKRKR